ncbi:hypothetical protein BH11PSE10_BH11PSE10_13450 [soil metagenome]
MSLVISHAQLTGLSDQRFEQRLTQLLRETDPAGSRQLDTPEGALLLHQQCVKARHYGLSTELEIAQYAISAWLLGPSFDTALPAMQEILSAKRLSATQKAEAIERVCSTVLAQLAGGRA